MILTSDTFQYHKCLIQIRNFHIRLYTSFVISKCYYMYIHVYRNAGNIVIAVINETVRKVMSEDTKSLT